MDASLDAQLDAYTQRQEIQSLTAGFDPSIPSARFIGATKNKLKREGMKASPEVMVQFDADRCRLSMPTEV